MPSDYRVLRDVPTYNLYSFLEYNFIRRKIFAGKIVFKKKKKTKKRCSMILIKAGRYSYILNSSTLIQKLFQLFSFIEI